MPAIPDMLSVPVMVVPMLPIPLIIEPPTNIAVGGGVNPVNIEVMVGLGAIAPGVFTTGTEVPWGIGVAVLVVEPGFKVAVGMSI